MNCIILGAKSEIAQHLRVLMVADGWKVTGWSRGKGYTAGAGPWDLVLIAMGRVVPVGSWWNQQQEDLLETFNSNLLYPVQLLQGIWNNRCEGASVCWLAGSNPNTIMDGYWAYNVSKMAVLKAVEQMDHESKDTKFFALGPGTILTKIHKASAGWDNPKLAAAYGDTKHLPENAIPRVYECLKWCISQPKEVIGGRNICASDYLSSTLLKECPDLFKLRRHEAS